MSEHATPDAKPTLADRLAAEEPLRLDVPQYVRTGEERRRWWVCNRISEALSMQHEPSGKPDIGFVWNFTRLLYTSPLELGSLDEVPDDRLAEMGLTREALAAALHDTQAQ